MKIGEIFEKHNGEIFRYFYLRNRSKEISEDLTSEVFIKFLNSKYDSRKSSVRTWLFIIARSIILNYYNSSSKIIPSAEIEDIELISDEKQINNDIDLDVKYLLDLLDDSSREIIILRFIEDLPVKEIAKILNVSYINAKVKIHRTLKFLKQKVNEK